MTQSYLQIADESGRHRGLIDYERSIFSGQMGGGMRRLVITGSAILNTSLAGVEDSQDFLRGLFEAQGWSLINFDFRKTGTWTVTFDINIEAYVPDDYTDQQHVDQAATILSNYEVSYGVGSTRAISDLRLRAGGSSSGQSGQNAASSGNYNSSPDGRNDKDPWTTFWEQLQHDLGVASSTLMVGGAILLVVMLKK